MDHNYEKQFIYVCSNIRKYLLIPHWCSPNSFSRAPHDVCATNTPNDD